MGGSCQILQYVQHMTPLYIWRSVDIEKILALALEDNSRERSSPSGKKKQIIATYAEYKK